MNAKRHIVIFSALYMPHLGGVEKYSQSLAAELSADFDVTVFCMNTEAQPLIVKEGNVTVYYLPCFPMVGGRFPVPKLAAFPIIKKFFSAHHIDFAIVQCRFYLLSAWACRFLSRKAVPFIQIEHGAGDVRMENPIVNAIWHLYEKILTEDEKRFPHSYYAVSHASLRWLEHFGIQGKGVISNSIKPADFEAAFCSDKHWRESQNISAEKLIIFFSGRIMIDKGITDLLNAFDMLKREDLCLVIAGSGEMNLVKAWENRDDIRFLGHVDFEDIPYILCDSQIFCLPSRFIEGQPTVILEAGYCGLPVVATANGGITEVIIDGETGLLHQGGNITELCDKLRYLIDRPDECKRLGANLQRKVQEKFTWSTAAKQIRDMISSGEY